MMTIQRVLCDRDDNLEAVTCCTVEHGGQFVIVGWLTLAGRSVATSLVF